VFEQNKKTMILKRAEFEKTVPRNVSDTQKRINIEEGLKRIFIIGSCFMSLGFVSIIIVSVFKIIEIPFPSYILLFFALVFFVFGLLFLRQWNKQRKIRYISFQFGDVVEGQIVRHEKKFHFWKLRYEHILQIAFKHGSTILRSRIGFSDEEMLELLEIGSKLSGFFHAKSNSIFFPAEIFIEPFFEEDFINPLNV